MSERRMRQEGKASMEVRTPAMQAGLAGRKLTFRDVLTAAAGCLLLVAPEICLRCRRQGLVLRLAAAQQQFLTEAPDAL